MKIVYLLMNSNGGIAIDISSSRGKVYADKETAERSLTKYNEWASKKDYPECTLVEMEVIE